MAHYGKSEFWDDRYTRDTEPFDWYQRFSGLKHIITKHIKTSAHVLMLGCGTSRLGEEMAAANYKDIMNIDISSVAISLMQEKYKDHPALTFKTMNALDMEFSDSSFDAVIDKGTMDALLCGDGSTANAEALCTQVSRVLKPGGIFILVTYGNPESRMQYLEKPKFNWRVDITTVEKPKVLSVGVESGGDDVHYVYIITKD